MSPRDAARSPSTPSKREEATDPTDGRTELTALARGGALNVVGTVMNAVLGFGLGLLIARVVGAHETGIFFEAVALFMIATVVTQLGADVGVVRAIPRYRALGRDEDARRCLPVALLPVAVASTALAVFAFVKAPEISSLVVRGTGDDALVPYLQVMAPCLPFAAVSKVLLSSTRGFGTMVPFVSIEYLAKPALRMVMTAVALLADLGSVGIALGWCIPTVLGFVAALAWLGFLVRRTTAQSSGDRTPEKSVAELVGDFWRFTSFRGAAAVFDVSVSWVDVLLVGALGSPKLAGIYAVASRFVTVGSFALQAMFLVVGPQISGVLARGEHARARLIYQASTAWLIVLSFPIYLTMAVFAPVLLGAFGPEFKSGSTALVILALAMLVNMGTGTVSVLLLMGGKSTWNLGNTVAALIVNVLLNVLLIPPLGLTGAAVAWAASIFVQNLTPLLQIWLLMRLQPAGPGYPVAVGAAGLCFGAIGLAAIAAFGVSLWTMIGSTTVAILLYAVLLGRGREALRLEVFAETLRRRTGAEDTAPVPTRRSLGSAVGSRTSA